MFMELDSALIHHHREEVAGEIVSARLEDALRAARGYRGRRWSFRRPRAPRASDGRAQAAGTARI